MYSIGLVGQKGRTDDVSLTLWPREYQIYNFHHIHI
jgi:hypothetical protein